MRLRSGWQTPVVRARDLTQSASAVRPGADAALALKTLASSGLPGLVVDAGGSFVVVPASQVLRVVLPRYVLDDPALGRVWDEVSAEENRAATSDKRRSPAR